MAASLMVFSIAASSPADEAIAGQKRDSIASAQIRPVLIERPACLFGWFGSKNERNQTGRALLARLAHRAGCSNSSSSKPAASEETRRTLRYVEPVSEVRTKLAGFFSILLV